MIQMMKKMMICSVFGLLSSLFWQGCSLGVQPIKVEPIKIEITVKIQVEKDLASFFDDIDSAASSSNNKKGAQNEK